MKVKRSLFVIVLVALFSICYFTMNKHYDEFARYPHELSEEQRELILQYLDADDINMLISQKIEPDEFLPYLEIEGFDLSNTLWYDLAYNSQKENTSKEFIVSFINKYKNQMTYANLESLLTNYSFNALIRFYDEGDQYQKSAKLIANPSAIYTLIKNKQTIYTYEPLELVSIGSLPHRSILSDEKDILIKAEVLQPLQQLCAAAEEINGKSCGDMKIVTGYLSYESQVRLYEIAAKKYSGDDFIRYWDYPGHSEYQLGYTVQLLPNELSADISDQSETESETPSEDEREQEIWLKDNAYKYGFIVRYSKSGENLSGKVYQPYTLRYVGKEMAKDIHDKGQTLEEINTNKYE